jgi:hypothetical protein
MRTRITGTRARARPPGACGRWLAGWCLAALCASAPVHAMRCGNRLVAEGDRDVQVRGRCGDPYWTDRWSTLEVVGAGGPVERQASVGFEAWYYNFGPRQLLRRLVFRDGFLVREETLGYGVDEIGTDCDPRRGIQGLTAGELVARCGEPDTRHVQADTLVQRPLPSIERWRDQRREEWIYDTGDRRRLRLVRFVDGRATGEEWVAR